MRAFPVLVIDSVEVDVVWHVQIKPHEHQLIVLTPVHCVALAHAVINEHLKEWIVFGVALEMESKERC